MIGIHNYYGNATMVAADFKQIAFSVHKSLNARLKKRVKPKAEVVKRNLPHNISKFIQSKYGESAQLKYVNGSALIPIGFVNYDAPMHRKKIVNSYTKEGREEIHKSLAGINMAVLMYLMKNPNPTSTIEFNDNRLSLYCAQLGKCAVSGVQLEIGNIHCHHITPKYLGGKDNYQNLILVTQEVHRLIHAKDAETITRYEAELQLTQKQRIKLEKYQKFAMLKTCIDERQEL